MTVSPWHLGQNCWLGSRLRGSCHHGCCSPVVRASVCSPLDHCSSFLQSLPFLLLILCSLCLTQQSMWWFKIYVSFHCSPQFKPHVTSDLSQSPNPTNGLQGPPRSALPLWPFQPWLDLFHSSRQILWLLCCFPVLPSLFPLSVFFCRCLYGSFPSSFWVSAQMSLPQWDRSLSATPPPLPAALALRSPWFVFLCYSHHQITRSLLVLLPPLGWKLCEVRDFSLFCSLNRITVGPEKASKY